MQGHLICGRKVGTQIYLLTSELENLIFILVIYILAPSVVSRHILWFKTYSIWWSECRERAQQSPGMMNNIFVKMLIFGQKIFSHIMFKLCPGVFSGQPGRRSRLCTFIFIFIARKNLDILISPLFLRSMILNTSFNATSSAVPLKGDSSVAV